MSDSPPVLRPPSIIRRHLATNAVDQPEVLIALACDESIMVRREAAKNPATPRWVLDLLVRAGADPELRGRLRPDPEMPPEDLRRLVECGPWAQMLVAEHPNTPADVLDVLSGQPDPTMRASVAAHPHAAANTLGRLCADAEVAVRHLANAHPARPADVYEVLRQAGADADLTAIDPDAAPGSTDPTILSLAAELGPWGVFLAARHRCCPKPVLERAATAADWRICSGVLDNPAAPPELLARAADVDGCEDEAEPTQVQALRLLAEPRSTAEDLAALIAHARPAVRLAVARHPGADSGLLSRLAADESAEIRRIAAAHPLTDAGDLELLVRAGSSADLMQLAEPDATLDPAEIDQLSGRGRWAKQLAVRHPATAARTLARLLCDADGKIREWAAAHPNAPAEIITAIRRAGGSVDLQCIAEPDPTMPEDALQEIAELGPWGALVVSWHPNAPADLAARRA